MMRENALCKPRHDPWLATLAAIPGTITFDKKAGTLVVACHLEGREPDPGERAPQLRHRQQRGRDARSFRSNRAIGSAVGFAVAMTGNGRGLALQPACR